MFIILLEDLVCDGGGWAKVEGKMASVGFDLRIKHSPKGLGGAIFNKARGLLYFILIVVLCFSPCFGGNPHSCTTPFFLSYRILFLLLK